MEFLTENLRRDVLVLMVSRGVRTFAYSTLTVGLAISTAFASAAILTAVWGFLSDRYGRKRILILLAALTIVSNTIYVFFSQLVFVFCAVIFSNVGAGGTGGGGQGGGPFNPVEQALLAEKCTAENRNRIFSTNAFVGSIMGSLGALVSGLPQYLQERWGWQPISSYKPLFALTIFLGLGLILAYASINEHHNPRKREILISKQAGHLVTRWSLLGVVDNLGAGLVGPLMSYWFYLRFGVELKALGFMFFLSYLLAALSFLAGPFIARHIGVVRTMAFSHGAASLLNMMVPFSPTFTLAATLTVARSFLAYMDNPLRSSFIMGVVRPEERGSAAGITSLSRQVPMTVSPTLAAYLMQAFSLNMPIFLGSFLQFISDCTFYGLFRHVKRPEERHSELQPAIH